MVEYIIFTFTGKRWRSRYKTNLIASEDIHRICQKGSSRDLDLSKDESVTPNTDKEKKKEGETCIVEEVINSPSSLSNGGQEKAYSMLMSNFRVLADKLTRSDNILPYTLNMHSFSIHLVEHVNFQRKTMKSDFFWT